MDENLIDQLYKAAQARGSKLTREQFAASIKSDNSAYQDIYSFAKNRGFLGQGPVAPATPASQMTTGLNLPESLSWMAPKQQPQPQLRTSGPVEPQRQPQGFADQYAGVDPRLMRGMRPMNVAESTMPTQQVRPIDYQATVDFQREEQRREQAVPGFVKPLMETITPELVGQEEENVVPQMNYRFGDLGFKFEESGATGDWMVATAPNGKTIEISLDPFSDAEEKKQANKLAKFIRDNTIEIEPEKLAEIEKQYKNEKKKFLSDEDMKRENSDFAKYQEDLKNELVEFNKLNDLVQSQEDLYSKGLLTDPTQFQSYRENKIKLESLKPELQSKMKDYEQREQQLALSVGKYTEMKAEQGTPYDLTIDALIRGGTSIISGIVDLALEGAYSVQPLDWLRSTDWIKEEYIKISEKDNISGPEKDSNGKVSNESYEKWWLGLSDDYKSDIQDRLKDQIKKEEKSAVINLINSGGEMLTSTTKEYEQSAKENWLSGVLLGAVESIPSFVGGGKIIKTAKLIGQSHDSMMDQMNNDPDFKNVSESEKMAASLPLSIVIAELEKFGFRNVISNKGLLNKLAMSSIGKAGATTTAKTFGELVRNDIKSGIARGTLTTIGGFLAEAETGAAQQIAELGVKNIYNAIKEKDMFNLPSTVGEYATEILEAAAAEGIGGMVLGMPSTIAAANRKQGYLGVRDDVFQLFEAAAFDSNVQTAFVNSLKNKVSAGELTVAQAKEQLNEYRNAAGLLRAVPQELDTQDKKQAMNLLRERRALEQQIDGKDEALVAPQKKRINEINNELTKLSENAVQKQAAGQVPVQPATAVGEEVAVGVPGAGSQVITDQGEEAVTPQAQEEVGGPMGPEPQLQLETSAQRSMPNEEMIQQATEQMSKIEDEGFSQEVFDATTPEPEVEMIPIEVTENTELANKVEKMGLSQLIGKKINLVMADQLKVGPVKAGKKILQRMGGPMFPLIDGLFGKVAWASMNNSAASAIINGAIKSDYTVVYNMNPSAIDSNVAMAQTFIEDVKGLGKEKQQDVFNKVVAQLDGKKFGKKTEQVSQIVASSKNLTQLMDAISGLDVDTKAKVINLILPSDKVKASTEIGKTLQAEGITIESVRGKNVEQFASNLPAGAMTMVLEVQDKNGNRITEATKNEAIITPEQQVAEGLPQHENYPVYIRGKAVAMLNETAPFWDVFKDSLNNINVKVAQVIKRASGRPFTSKEARSAEMRAASMTANKARKVSAPSATMYEKFLSLISRSFPSVEIVKTQKEFDELLANLNAKKLATKNQNVYGAVYNGKLYLNPSLENYNTPIHEFGHIWLNVAKEANRELYNKGISLIKESPYINQVLNSPEYKRVIKQMKKDGATQEEIDSYVQEEALATAIGDKGESFVIAAQRKSFKQWLNTLYSFVKNLTGISEYSAEQLEDITLDEFLQAVSADLLSGRKLFEGAEAKSKEGVAQLSTKPTMPPIQNATVVVTGTRRGMENLSSNNWNEDTDPQIGDVRGREAQFNENTFVVDTGADPFYRRNPGTKIINYKVDAVDAVGRPGFLQVSLIVPEDQVVDNNILKSVLDERVAAIMDKYMVGTGDELRLARVPNSEFTLIQEALVDALASPPTVATEEVTRTEEVVPAEAAPVEEAQPEAAPVEEAQPAPEPAPIAEEGGVETIPGYDRMMQEVDGIIERSQKRGVRYNKIMDNVMKYVMGSKVYEDASDVQREALVRQVRKMFEKKEKRAPSAKKVLGQKKTEVVVKDDLAALNDQIRLEARAARESKQDINAKRKQLTEAVRKMAEGGKLSAKKVAAIINKIGKLNLDNQISVDRFLNYASKVFADADYADKLGKANSLRKKIRKASKNSDKPANLREIGVNFSQIDPSMVEDIDTYNQNAEAVLESIKGSTIRGTDVKFADIISEETITPYINETLDAQSKKMFDEKVEEVRAILGIDASNLTYDQLAEILAGKEPETKYDKAIVMDAIRKAFSTYSTIIKEMLATGKDPFTGEDVEFTDSQRKTITAFMNMDIGLMDSMEALQAVDGLLNFIQNKSTAKMESVLGEYNGINNARILDNRGLTASPLRKYWSPRLGKWLGEQVTNMNVLFERMFKGVLRGGMVEDMSGFTALRNGKSAAQAESNRIVNDFVEQFYKREANGSAFNTAYNAIERGLAAFMTRTIMGTQAEMDAEFERRKGLVNESIDVLSLGNREEVEKAILYREAYDKIVEGSKNINDISSKVDPTNMEAVNFWRSQWASKYDQLSDVSLNVYNKILEKDINYGMPDRFSRLSTDTGALEISTDEMGFHSNNGTLYKKETGVLMSATRPDALPVNPKTKRTVRYVDLSFDKVNSNSMYDALVDINTAAPIRQVESFINSKYFDRIVTDPDDRAILSNRISLFVRNIRNKTPYTEDELSKSARKLNRIAAIGVGQALGGVLQPVKQMIPVAMNTLVNAGRLDMGSIFDKDKMAFINRSGYAIANRGIESQAMVESLNKLIEQASKSKPEKAIELIEKANNWWLKQFLVKPDLFIARMSWMTYYENGLKRQGIDPSTIDYSTHEVNEDAANYAQRMVDRQQNVSDADLAGKLLADRESTKQIFIKMLMPFASFRMNQSARLGSDLATLMSNTSTAEDKVIAARSLSGFGVETAVFRMVSAGAIMLTTAIVNSIMGTSDDDDEDERRDKVDEILDQIFPGDKEKKPNELEKQVDNILKGQLTSAINDIFSPLPLLDKPIQYVASNVIDKVQDVMGIPDDEKLSTYPGNKQDFIQSLGLFGIAAERAGQLYEVADLAFNGTFEDEYGKVKVVTDRNREVLKYLIGPALMSNIGLAPSEVNSVVRGAIKKAKKDAVTELTEEQKIQKTLLQGFKSKSDMERYAPELYEATFGPGGAEDILLPNLRSEKEAKRKLRELKKAIKDEMYNYEPKKEEKKGWFGGSEFGGKQKKKGGFGSSKFGSKGFGQ
jgi:hypothetical protein